MKITVAVITPQDYEKFNAVGMNAEACLADRVKLICQDDAGHVAESFMKQDEFDRLGLAYIEQHAKLEHSEVCDEWFMKCSQNSWYNNLERNPEKVIKVMFVGIEDGTGREVYRGVETHRYYSEGMKLQDSINFAADGLFCEWAWVIDLDAGTFEGYCGFGQTSLAENDRFYFLRDLEKDNGYHGVRLAAKWNLDALPTDEEFLTAFKNDDEEETPTF